MAAAMPKITVPCMSGAFPRTQVFERLTGFADAKLIWVSAPPGYGKTTAISTYLRERNRATVWYQCDEGDEDIASFFHFIALGVRHLHSARLPKFAPEYLSALPVFCRNFFRVWFANLASASSLVLDNWQDVPSTGALRGLLPTLVEEVPAAHQVIVISRDEPDASMSRLAVSDRMQSLGIHELQLSEAETREIALRQTSGLKFASTIDVAAIHKTTQGWPAAVTLLLRRGASSAMPSEAVGGQAIFDYLAAEAFERLAGPIQAFLLRVACVEHITVAVSQAVSEREDAASILAALVHQNIFTAYRSVSDSYYFHPLFRSFLLLRSAEVHCPADRRRFVLVAARASIAAGQPEAGINLLIEAQAWAEAAAGIGAIAAAFVDQVRVATLSSWIDALPRSVVTLDAGLLYWRGVCRMTLDFSSARAPLEQAYARFCATADLLGQSLACAAILQHITYSYMDYRPMLPWLERPERTLEGMPPFEDARTELKLRAAFMLALSQAVPKHPKLADSVERVSALVRSERDIVALAEGVGALLHFFSRFGRTAQYGDLDTVIERLLNEPTLAPTHRINLLWLNAYRLHASGDPEHVMQILGEARALARHEGLHTEDTRMRLCELQAQEVGASRTAALATFSELEPLLRGMPCIPRAHFLYVRSLFELACGHSREALRYAEEALPLIRTSHWHIGEALALTGLAEVYCAAGRHEDAGRCIEECLLITDGIEAPLVDYNLQLVRAEIARCREDAVGLNEALVKAFAIGREQGYANGFHTGSQLLKRLVTYGIERAIEPSYCRWVIDKRRFIPPRAGAARWPWRVKIRALGRLQIFIDDAELKFSGKTQRKPLDLLKLLIARPSGVELGLILDELWADLDGDAARNALDIALYRLRKMLKFKDAILLRHGSVAINENVVWLDVIAFERMASQGSHTAFDTYRDLDETFDLYRGSLLSAEEAPRMVALSRDRLKAQFAHTVVGIATRLTTTNNENDIQRLYLRAIEREPAEQLFTEQLRRVIRNNVIGARVDGRPLG